MDTLETTLRERFGLDDFRPGQRQVMETLLAGRSAAAVFPTGGGKSLCYQLPALLLDGVTLVVSPLIALMKDQIDALTAIGVPAARLDSSLTADEARAVMEGVRSGTLRLLYVAPERFNNERFREAIVQTRVSLFAVDEAHCVSEWGHNFRPDYLKLARFAARCGAERTLALTATATPLVLVDICRELDVATEDAVRTGFYRPNLTLLPEPVTRRERDARLVSLLREHPPGPAIVYVTLQRTAERVAKKLAEAGLPARPYHAGLDRDIRSETQEWFLASPEAIVVATIAFGMGIDKPDIRYVLHYNLPKSLENLSQEIGRAGRDGEPADCRLLACPDDMGPLENFAHGDTPDADAVEALVDALFGEELEEATERIDGAPVLDLAMYELSGRTDVRPIVIRTLLTYLELDGWLEGGTPRYSVYRFKPSVPSSEILEAFDGERRDFVRAVLASSKKGRTWFTLDADNAARRSGTERERVVRMLDWMSEQGWMELKAEKVRHRYRVVRVPSGDAERAELSAELHRRALARETGELERLAKVVALIEADECQVSRLGAHFGEPLPEPCGHCAHCLNGGKITLPPRDTTPIDDETWTQALAIDEPLLERPRALARFLCGVASPRLSKAKLHRHALFGAQRFTPFLELLERAERDLG